MSGNEAYELAVAIKPTGTRETERQLDSIEESFDETADTAEDSAADLEGFADRWKGAMTVTAGALTAATGAILARVPVIQESTASLNMVLTSLALKLDEELRPAIGDVNDELADMSNEIDAAEDEGEVLKETIKGVTNVADEIDTISVTADILISVGDVAIKEGTEDFERKFKENFKNRFFGIANPFAFGVAIFNEVFKGLTETLLGKEITLSEIASIFPSAAERVSLGKDMGRQLGDALVDEFEAVLLDEPISDKGSPASSVPRTGQGQERAHTERVRNRKQTVRDRVLDPTGQSLQGHTTEVTLETDTQKLESEVKDTFGDALGHRGRLIR